jgi:trans-aconitate methyltransferase
MKENILDMQESGICQHTLNVVSNALYDWLSDKQKATDEKLHILMELENGGKIAFYLPDDHARSLAV